MSPVSKRRIILGVLVVLALSLMATTVAAYAVYFRHSESPAVRSISRVLGFPAARVGDVRVPYAEFVTQMEAVRVFVNGPAAASVGIEATVTPEVKAQALERLVRIAAVEKFAAERDIVVTPIDVDRAFESVREGMGASSTQADVESYLGQAFGWGVREFKQYVVRPALLEDLLKKKAFDATKDAEAFEKELEVYLAGDQVRRYLTFK